VCCRNFQYAYVARFRTSSWSLHRTPTYDARNAVVILGRPDHRRADASFRGKCSAGVVEVMCVFRMCVSFRRAQQAPCAPDRARRIDNGGQALVGIMDQIGVIVLQTGDEFDSQALAMKGPFWIAPSPSAPGAAALNWTQRRGLTRVDAAGASTLSTLRGAHRQLARRMISRRVACCGHRRGSVCSATVSPLPYLRPYLADAERVVSLMPRPARRRCLAC